MVLLVCTLCVLLTQLLTLSFVSVCATLVIKTPTFSHLSTAYYLIARLTSLASSVSPTILSFVVPSALRFHNSNSPTRTLVNRAYQLTRTLLFPARAETVESTTSTVEDGGRERLWSGCEISLSQPTKYIALTVHKAPELTELQAASYVGVRYTWPLELARETELRWKSSLFVEVESLCGATSYPLRTPRLEDTVLDAHTREPITVITERYLGVLRFCRCSQPGHNQKLAHLIPEIRVERSHLMFFTICHKIDITTGYYSWVEIHPYKKKQ